VNSPRRRRAISGPTAAVLRALAEGASYGFDVMDATGLASGTVYPILSRSERDGWVETRWEDPEEHRREGRPARKYYRLTPDGRAALGAAVERFRALGRPLGGEA
jgi:PadR family transcriptional regulator, regulatory protein PadR